jgi:formamidopyrimidine-DNA glycosylase
VPELPEVETIRRQLAPEVEGRRIDSVEILDERLTRPVAPTEVERAIEGRRVESVGRRGKYLLLTLEGGRTLALHLRMTGNLLLRPPGDGHLADLMEVDALGGPRLYEAPSKLRFLRARILLDDRSELLFTDMRRFGQAVVLADDDELEGYFAARLGVEPLSPELTPEAICRLAAGRKAPLKSFLLTQSIVAGLGNIYADEALWRAELHPLSPAGSLRLEHCDHLVRGIIDALQAGLDFGGASIDDYRDVRGERGSMQDEFLVHTREGEECRRCGSEIRRIVVGGRSTYYCPGCQRRLRRRPRRASRPRRGRSASGTSR